MRSCCRLPEGGPHSFANSRRVVIPDCSEASNGTSAVAFGGSVRYGVHPASTTNIAVRDQPSDHRPLKEHRPILQRKVARRAADFCETVFQVE